MHDKITMPRKEHSGEVDLIKLGLDLKSLSESTDAYDRVEVHV